MSARPIEVLSLAATVHGRLHIARPTQPGPHPLLVGLHGYGENATRHLEELLRIPGSEALVVVAVEALHRFYSSRTKEVVGSWMTREAREIAIADNLVYLDQVIAMFRREHPGHTPLVIAGFSQGVAMAYRVAARRPDVAGIIALAGDVPPDVKDHPGLRLPPILLGRGDDDSWYSEEVLATDLGFLSGVGAEVECVRFAGGHVWTDPFRRAAGEFLVKRMR